MRISALVPILLGLAAIALSFLCLFAGSKTTFLADYSIITLNTSQLGNGVLNSSLVNNNPRLAQIFDQIPDNLQNAVEDVANSYARRLGLRDFYSAHILAFCEGYYEPTAVPNATVRSGDIDKNITSCSNRTYEFDPRDALQEELDANGVNLNVSDLNWPSEIDQGLGTLHIAQRATFVLYCVAIGLIALAVVAAGISLFLSGRLSACLNIIITTLAFLAIALASSITTAIAVKGTNIVNQYGNQVGVAATRGTAFLGLTWGATAAMAISVIYWFVDCCIGRRNRGTRNQYAEKHSY